MRVRLFAASFAVVVIAFVTVEILQGTDNSHDNSSSGSTPQKIIHWHRLSPTDANLEIRNGRYMVQPTTLSDNETHHLESNIVAYDFPGVTVSMKFSNATVIGVRMFQVQATKKPNDQFLRFNVSIDPAPPTQAGGEPVLPYTIITTAMQDLRREAINYTLFTDLDPAQTYRVTALKITEAMFWSGQPKPNFVEFHGFLVPRDPATGRYNITVLNAKRSYNRRIEFIGDSITCGFCNECKVSPLSQVVDLETYYGSYAHITCAHFEADCHTEAWAGLGMYRSPSFTSSNYVYDVTVPMIYNRTLATVNSSRWDFNYSTQPSSQAIELSPAHQSSWEPPQVVVINLGTNDHLDPVKPWSSLTDHYRENYRALIHQIVFYYGSDVEVFLVCGPMTESYCPAVYDVIQKVEPWAKVHWVNQTGILNSGNTCCQHPDLVAHRIMANRTIERIDEIMGESW